VFYILHGIVNFAFVETAVGLNGIATVHTVFNLLTTALLFPFTRQLEKLAYWVIKKKVDKTPEEEQITLDERLLAMPALAVSKCMEQTEEMALLAQRMVGRSIRLMEQYDPKEAETVLKGEELLDRYEDMLGTALVKLSAKELSIADNQKVSLMLHTIGDLERIGDHAVNLCETAQEIHEKKITFSHAATGELSVLTAALQDILQRTISAFVSADRELAVSVEPLEQVIDALVTEIKSRHVRRLQSGSCTIELGFVLSDLLGNYERVSDHCSNIAAAAIEIGHDSFDTHRYLKGVKTGHAAAFEENYARFSNSYALQSEEG